jgi:hypothetical protein
MTIALPDKYPKLIRDLFLYDTVENPVPTSCANYESLVCSNFGFLELKMPFDLKPEVLLAEAQTLDWTQKKGDYVWLYGQDKPLQEKIDNGMGFDVDTKYETEFKIEPNNIPEFRKFYDNLNQICPITDITLKKVKPGGWMNPHVDSYGNPFKIYMALSWPKGNYFKMYNKGFIPLNSGKAFWVNVGAHSHCVVNDSTEERIIISLYADWDTPQWRQVVEHSYKNRKKD